MPAQPDDFEPTEADIDMVMEEAAGKPLKPENLAAGIAAMQQRIAQLVAEKTRLLDRIAVDSDATLLEMLATLNKNLTSAQTRLAHYRAQKGRHN